MWSRAEVTNPSAGGSGQAEPELWDPLHIQGMGQRGSARTREQSSQPIQCPGPPRLLLHMVTNKLLFSFNTN